MRIVNVAGRAWGCPQRSLSSPRSSGNRRGFYVSEGDLFEESGALIPGESSRPFINSVKSAPFKGHDSIRSKGKPALFFPNVSLLPNKTWPPHALFPFVLPSEERPGSPGLLCWPSVQVHEGGGHRRGDPHWHHCDPGWGKTHLAPPSCFATTDVINRSLLWRVYLQRRPLLSQTLWKDIELCSSWFLFIKIQ